MVSAKTSEVITNINSNIYFITFGGGYKNSHSRTSPENYHKAVARICKEAASLNIFNKIYGITENYLLNYKFFQCETLIHPPLDTLKF